MVEVIKHIMGVSHTKYQGTPTFVVDVVGFYLAEALVGIFRAEYMQ